MDPREQNSIKFYNLSQEVAQMNPLLSLHLLFYSAEFLTSLHKELKARNDPRTKQVETQLLNMLGQIQTLKAQNPQSKDQARQQLGQYILQGISQTQQALMSGTNPNDLVPWFRNFLSYIEMMENLQNLDPQLAQQRNQIISTLGQIQQNQQIQQQQQQQQQEQTPGFSQQTNNPMKSTVRQPNNNNINATYETPQGNVPFQQIGLPPQQQLLQNQFSNNNGQQPIVNSSAPTNNFLNPHQEEENLPEEVIQKLKNSHLTDMDVKAVEIILEQTQISPIFQQPVQQPSQRQQTQIQPQQQQLQPQQQQQPERIKSIYHPPGMDTFGQDGMLNLQPPCIPPLYSNLDKEETKDQNETNYFFNKSNDNTCNNNNNVPSNSNNNNIVPSNTTNNNFGTPGFDGVSIPSQIKKPSPPPPALPPVVAQQPKTLPIPPSSQLPAQQLPTSFNPREKGKVKLMAIKNIEQIIQQARTGKNEELKAQLTETIRLLDSVKI